MAKNINDTYYQQYYQFQGRSTWMEKIWSEAFGEEYPEGLDHYGYLTNHDLSEIHRILSLKAEDIFLDVGCGKGGPGFRLAELSSAKLLGIDIIEEAIIQARKLASKFQLSQEALFTVGEFHNIPLDDEMVDHVISIDSLWAAIDKERALSEIYRVLKVGGKFVFTNWDTIGQDPIHLYEKSGMKFISRKETPLWKSYQKKIYKGIATYKDDLISEMGDGARMLIYESEASLPYLDSSVRRIYHLEKPLT